MKIVGTPSALSCPYGNVIFKEVKQSKWDDTDTCPTAGAGNEHHSDTFGNVLSLQKRYFQRRFFVFNAGAGHITLPCIIQQTHNQFARALFRL
jgi:hypothetical protein